MTTKCQLCRNWKPGVSKHALPGYRMCAARPDGTAPMIFMAAWNIECVGKFVPIVPIAAVRGASEWEIAA